MGRLALYMFGPPAVLHGKGRDVMEAENCWRRSFDIDNSTAVVGVSRLPVAAECSKHMPIRAERQSRLASGVARTTAGQVHTQ